MSNSPPSLLAASAGLAAAPGVYGAPSPAQQPAVTPPPQEPGVLKVRNSGSLRVEFDRDDGPCVLTLRDPLNVLVRISAMARDKQASPNPGAVFPEDVDVWRAALGHSSVLFVPANSPVILTDTEAAAIIEALFEWQDRVGKASAPTRS